jgi:predicted dithiol-disulfide oxidoreductase (DUF899 family)
MRTVPSLQRHRIVSRNEWLQERIALLAKEKAFTRARDALAAERQALPWVKIEKNYAFDGPKGKVTLSDLFAGRSQLFLKHFMMAPGQVHPCVGCSLEIDHVEGILVHLENHDVAFAAVARAPIEEIEAYRRRMNWGINWVSSYGYDFNFDFHVSFTPEQLAAKRTFYNFGTTEPEDVERSGSSVFFKDESGQIFHTYSVFGRGVEDFLGVYTYLELTPKGRNEGDLGTLSDWVRLRDTYGRGGMVEENGRYHPSECACSVHK